METCFPDLRMAPSSLETAKTILSGTLHIYVAFDWGELVDLQQASALAPATSLALARRSRTPSSIAFKPAPLCFRLAPLTLPLSKLDQHPVLEAEATVFDFAAASVALQVPFHLTPTELTELAGRLADPASAWSMVQAARAAVQPLYQKLLPAIEDPLWNEDLWEEYYVFQFTPGGSLKPQELLTNPPEWLLALLRLEDEPLSTQEAAESLRLNLRYGVDDLLIADWGASILLDFPGACDETLQTIEFANLQLLEYRFIDDRLDLTRIQAERLLNLSRRSHRLSWRTPRQALRQLSELQLEVSRLFEQTGNTFKLIGDQYLARVYRLLASRFHLPDWEKSIQRKLDVIHDIYQAISDQAANFRAEFMELIIILLILIEVIMGFIRH